jgi:4-oxalocrotonate tautomerase
MPIAIIHLMEGRDDQKKARAIAAVTQALAESLDAKPETVRVILLEVPRASWGIAGKPAASKQ